MEQFISYSLLGIMLGAIYALLAIGYSLVFGVLFRLNLAHGDIFMSGAFVAAFLSSTVSLWFAIPIGIAAATALGILLYFVVFDPVKGSEEFLGPKIGSLAFGMILATTTGYFAGGYTLQFPQPVELQDIHVGDSQISSIQLLVLIIATFSMIGFQLLIRHTKFGRSMRAIAESETAARLLGVNVRSVIVTVFAVSSAGAGLAGILYAIRYGVVDPYFGFHMGLIGLIVMVMGGIGSVIGAMVAGILLGLIQMLATGFLWSGAQQVVPWIVLVLVLIVRPEGIFGSRSQEERV
jgi:branched-chain amino acid transport system permease protein